MISLLDALREIPLRSVIAIEATQNCGKSTTIKEEIWPILKLEADTIILEDYSHRELKTMFRIKDLFLGIDSQGDWNGRYLTQSAVEFMEDDVNIILTATCYSGRTRALFDETARKYGYRTHIIPHKVRGYGKESNWKELNRRTASAALEEVRTLMSQHS
jgi:hypothetical protein